MQSFEYRSGTSPWLEVSRRHPRTDTSLDLTTSRHRLNEFAKNGVRCRQLAFIQCSDEPDHTWRSCLAESNIYILWRAAPEAVMVKKTILSVFLVATFASSALTPGSFAQAQQFDDPPPYRHEDWRDPPPPERRHHHHHDGSAIAGGVAAGLIGGIIGGAIANGGAYEPPPPPRCWYESRPVQNEYDDGWHNERMRVCE
jgi:hypothetical protein